MPDIMLAKSPLDLAVAVSSRASVRPTVASRKLRVSQPGIYSILSTFGLRVASVLGVILTLLAGPGSRAANRSTWIQVRSPNFIVVTNDKEKHARLVAREFELIRAVFLEYFGRTGRTDPPITILAAKDEPTLHSLIPEFWEKKNSMHPAGIFLNGVDANYVLLRLDISLNQEAFVPFEAVYHEYVHYLMRRLRSQLPLWMVEGLAEFYGNTRIESKRVFVGVPNPTNVALLREKQLLPVRTLFEIDSSSPYYHEESKTSIFYAEAWVLTHYLITRDWTEKTRRMIDFVALLGTGMDQREAARRTIGDPASLEPVLQKYIQRFSFTAEAMEPPKIEESAFQARELSDAESLSVRADFMAHDRHYAEAQAMLEESLKLDPKLSSAYASMGFLYFQQRRIAEAGKWYADALALDPRNYFAHYGYAFSLLMGTLNDDLAAKAESSLRAAIKIDPGFAPAYDSLAYLLALTWHNQNPDEAYRLALAAVEIEPGNVSYRVRAVNTLERLGRAEDAIVAANLATSMAITPQDRAATSAALASAKQFQAYQKQAGDLGKAQNLPMPAAKGPQATSEKTEQSVPEQSQASSAGQASMKAESPTEQPDKQPAQTQSGNSRAPIDVLSDTGGVDVSTYLKVVYKLVDRNWRVQMPESVYPPLLKKGKVIIGFRLLQDGKVEDLRVVQTSGDNALDRAAYRAIANSSPLSPIAPDFHCMFLELRFNFYYNESITQSPPPASSLLPCVKTKIVLPGETGVAVSPSSIQVAKTTTQQFTATVVGEQDSPVTWKVSGKGCVDSACGSISPTGVYTAPSAIPIPATVTITATLQTAGHETASAVVTIVESPPSQ